MQHHYTHPRWNKLRKRRLFLDGYRCRDCGSRKNLQVHHIISIASGGEVYSLDNLKTLCKECHEERHGQEQIAPREDWQQLIKESLQ